MKKIELEVIALSHSISQTHNYAVVLGEVGGMRRMPIVIGAFEAQSIAIALEKMSPSRPLTHDLMKNLALAFGIEVREVIINNLAEGIFYAQLICKKGEETLEIDSRTSDALALALRFDCPIYTYDFILESAGVLFEEGEEEGKAPEKEAEPKSASKKTPKKEEKKLSREDISKLNIRELNEMLRTALEKEDYERAIQLRDEISRRKKQG